MLFPPDHIYLDLHSQRAFSFQRSQNCVDIILFTASHFLVVWFISFFLSIDFPFSSSSFFTLSHSSFLTYMLPTDFFLNGTFWREKNMGLRRSRKYKINTNVRSLNNCFITTTNKYRECLVYNNTVKVWRWRYSLSKDDDFRVWYLELRLQSLLLARSPDVWHSICCCYGFF